MAVLEKKDWLPWQSKMRAKLARVPGCSLPSAASPEPAAAGGGGGDEGKDESAGNRTFESRTKQDSGLDKDSGGSDDVCDAVDQKQSSDDSRPAPELSGGGSGLAGDSASEIPVSGSDLAGDHTPKPSIDGSKSAVTHPASSDEVERPSIEILGK